MESEIVRPIASNIERVSSDNGPLFRGGADQHWQLGRTAYIDAPDAAEDVLLLMRLAREVRQQSGKVSFRVKQEYLDLCRRCPYIDIVTPWGADVSLRPDVNAVYSRCFSTLEARFGAPRTGVDAVPYVFPEPERVAFWRKALDGLPRGLRVGVMGECDLRGPHTYERSLPCTGFDGLTKIPGVQLFDLSPLRCHTRGVNSRLRSAPVIEAGGDLGDLAAFIWTLDLVIAAESVVSHLAGSMAVPLWLTLSPWADLRWQLQREDTPWYVGARVFRRASAGGWENVLARIRAELSVWSAWRLGMRPAAAASVSLVIPGFGK